ncbi:lactonase family protein [Flavobacterium sp. J372]|uniref:lactonase family protein n=1 Tax=Flavobacterium sp. J372 TaxID=2898436 RepID=UPI002150CAAB|nr:lactonase family protein [Flavobacterium sp. J372]MCR5861785.1 lactonase family protein [Flavobacterium sp. J372]
MKLFRLALFLLIMTNAAAQDTFNLVVGTYTDKCRSEGIYVYEYNANTAEVKPKSVTKGVISPSFLAVSPDKKFIYSVNENGEKSTISSFKYNKANGKIDFINKKDSEGDSPCYIIADEKNVITANYGGGSLVVYHRRNDGGLTEAKQVVQHTGNSINKERQEKAHVHMVYFSPDKKYVFCNDLGTDKIYIYAYNPDGGSKTLTLKETIDAKPGSGPRHLVFNPNGIFFYVLHELDASLVAYSYINQKVEKIQETSLVMPGATGKNGGADIKFTRDGKYLYATNRGDANTISVFKVHSNGMIKMVQQLPTDGDSPRNLAIDPKDNHVLVGHQNSSSISIFKRNKTTGMLEDNCKRIDLCSPVCLVFTEAK